ncbi:MAG: acyl-CoA dehydrogenase family protein [Bradyrhizobium sp.]
MDFALSDAQKALQETARKYAREVVRPKAAHYDETSHFPKDLISQGYELGLMNMTIPEEYGGMGLSHLDQVIITEELAWGCAGVATSMIANDLALLPIHLGATPEQKKRFVKPFSEKLKLASFGLTEPGAGSDVAGMSTTIRRDGDHYVLNGQKQFISGAGSGDVYVVMVRTGADGPGGISSLVIEGDTPGLSLGANERKMGWNAQPTRAVIFENARVPVANRLGEEGIGFKIAMAGLDGGRINIAACSLGGAQSALDKSLAYMKERKAFGKRLDEFQALQFRLADMATELEAARTFVWRAAAALDRRDPDATMLCAMAKRFGTDVGFEVANQALQLHGGYGYLSEYGIEKIVRDLRVHQILEGTNEIMRLIVARKLIEHVR